MATLSLFSPPNSICFSLSLPSPATTSPSLPFRNVHFKLVAFKAHRSQSHRLSRVNAVEEDTQIPLQEEEPSTSELQPVVVPITPSDTLTMLFQAEGTMNGTAIPYLTKALEETEGVANVKIQIAEGIATVELKKQTTVHATGVASGLLETIQGSGFKLQTLNLSFDDEEDAAA